jgi:hypothetical protein
MMRFADSIPKHEGSATSTALFRERGFHPEVVTTGVGHVVGLPTVLLAMIIDL